MFGEIRLENGIRVVSEALKGTRAVALGITVEVGPQNEPANKTGIAHLAEHLFFQGTSTRSARDIALLMDRAGGSVGAFTSRDYTFFGACVLDDYLPYALELMGDILLNAIFPDDRVEMEKQSILAELARAEDDPQALAHDILKCLVWGDHPLGRPIAGTAESVAALSREDLIYFVNENYLPDRIIVSAAGNIHHDDLADQVRDSFWRMIGKSARPRHRQSIHFRQAFHLEEKALSQIYFTFGIPALPYTHPNRYAIHLLSKILGGGLSSRLYCQLREKEGLVYYISADYHAYRETGMFIIEGCTPPQNLQKVIELLCHELNGLAKGSHPISDEELNTAQMSMRGQHLLESEDTQTRMTRLALQTLYFDKPIATQSILDGFMNFQTEALNHFTQTYLTNHKDQWSFAGVGPCSQFNIECDSVRKWMGSKS